MLEKFWQIRCTVQYVTEEAIAKGQKVFSQREGNGRKCIHIYYSYATASSVKFSNSVDTVFPLLWISTNEKADFLRRG